jgi:hypothetical protein
MTQQELADALNLNQSQVSRYSRRGMPVTDIDAAKAWICKHVNITLHAPQWRRQVRARPTPDPVDAVEALNVLLRDHLADKAMHADIVPRLQAAMRSVPPHRRGEVHLFLGVWEVLLGRMPPLLEDENHDEYIPDGPWYGIACDEAAP